MGILIGIGYYFCISARSTALGFDTIAIILHDRNPKINLALTIYICNVIGHCEWAHAIDSQTIGTEIFCRLRTY